MNRIIRIGTRDSRLAVWQAGEVRKRLSAKSHLSSVEFIKSHGDLDLITPLYEAGVQGIFTKALDVALLEKKIDIAVHSYKDVPTRLAEGLLVAAVLKRGNPFDVLVCKSESVLQDVQAGIPLTIATSSVRRKAQWLFRYRNSQIENIRGNVQTRLRKLRSSPWHGTILAATGLQRLELTFLQTGPQLQLDWMLPAPAQGAIVIICRKEDHEIISACYDINHGPTRICTAVERHFLRLMQGGCSTPISALATIDENEINFNANITATDGNGSISVSIREKRENASLIAQKAVNEMKIKSANELLLD